MMCEDDEPEPYSDDLTEWEEEQVFQDGVIEIGVDDSIELEEN